MVAVLAAMDGELSVFEKRLSSPRVQKKKYPRIISGTIGGCEVLAVRTGVGKVLSAASASNVLSHYNVDTLVYVGIAGALRSEPAIGDIVVARDSLQHDLDATIFGFELGEVPYEELRIVPSAPELVEKARKFDSNRSAIHVGRILTGDRFLTTAKRRDSAYLVEELDGWAVDMEGAAAGLVAYIEGIDFLLARVISDRADGKAPGDFSTFLPRASGLIADFVEHVITA